MATLAATVVVVVTDGAGKLANIGAKPLNVVGLFLEVAQMASNAKPHPNSTSSSLTPKKLAAAAMTPVAASSLVFTADLPKFHNACSTTAMMTGFTP